MRAESDMNKLVDREIFVVSEVTSKKFPLCRPVSIKERVSARRSIVVSRNSRVMRPVSRDMSFGESLSEIFTTKKPNLDKETS